MRLVHDPERCRGHQSCLRSAPEFFRIKEDGFAELLFHGQLTEDQLQQAELAMANCPEMAIDLVD